MSVTADGDSVDTTPPTIKIKADPENQKIIIEDTGVGMNRYELINNLGRIAQSGTKNFMLVIRLVLITVTAHVVQICVFIITFV